MTELELNFYNACRRSASAIWAADVLKADPLAEAVKEAAIAAEDAAWQALKQARAQMERAA